MGTAPPLTFRGPIAGESGPPTRERPMLRARMRNTGWYSLVGGRSGVGFEPL